MRVPDVKLIAVAPGVPGSVECQVPDAASRVSCGLRVHESAGQSLGRGLATVQVPVSARDGSITIELGTAMSVSVGGAAVRAPLALAVTDPLLLTSPLVMTIA